MTAKVISFNKKRQENIEKKKRQFERVLFSEFVGAYTELDGGQQGIFALQVIDISQTGCLLAVEDQENFEKVFKQNATLRLRFYFTKKSFIPAEVKVMRTEKTMVGGKKYYHIGCEFDENLPSYQAIRAMVGFMYQYAEHSCNDGQEKRVFFL